MRRALHSREVGEGVLAQVELQQRVGVDQALGGLGEHVAGEVQLLQVARSVEEVLGQLPDHGPGQVQHLHAMDEKGPWPLAGREAGKERQSARD